MVSNEVAAERPDERITHLDGVRGIAIAMVLVFHSWGNLKATRTTSLFDFVASQGLQGVSLFFVISGFCLSFPLWRRRLRGVDRWFVPSQFFVRRCLRILPPYYVALVVFALVKVYASHHPSQVLSSREGPLTTTDMLSHVLLIHNLTPYINSINGMFWSLGLEWQWYWVFPLVLVLCIRSGWFALAACFGITVFWHLGMHDLWGLGALPPRLFEFACGILAAGAVARRQILPSGLLWLGLIVPLAIIESAQANIVPYLSSILDSFALRQPLFGVSFASLLLLGQYSRVARSALSWKPLVLLGISSYSIYLVHGPVLTRLYTVAPSVLKQTLLIVPLALALGVVSGALFHIVVERPFMRKSTWTRVTPHLTRAFTWTDAVWVRFTAVTPVDPGIVSPPQVAASLATTPLHQEPIQVNT